MEKFKKIISCFLNCNNFLHCNDLIHPFINIKIIFAFLQNIINVINVMMKYKNTTIFGMNCACINFKFKQGGCNEKNITIADSYIIFNEFIWE